MDKQPQCCSRKIKLSAEHIQKVEMDDDGFVSIYTFGSDLEPIRLRDISLVDIKDAAAKRGVELHYMQKKNALVHVSSVRPGRVLGRFVFRSKNLVLV